VIAIKSTLSKYKLFKEAIVKVARISKFKVPEAPVRNSAAEIVNRQTI
jgi:hypothetical protein